MNVLTSYCAALLIVAGAFAQGAGSEKSGAASIAEKEGRLLTGIRQLTFEGRRAGEGYFSADGAELVFQSERDTENPFYQIYLMDLETGDVERISPGVGKTTCAWIHPSGKKVLFASTHEDEQAKAKQKAELEARRSGKQRRYAWDYDETFELYEYDRESGRYRALTDARGYDEEGSYSPDGSKIAFSSNRHAYQTSLTPEQQRRFDIDKSYLCDIYIMDADGSNVKRLTDTAGYDGGPFFSPDGRRICWRRFSPSGETAEVYTMDIDGDNVRQLTNLGAMSWAPFYHPSNEYLIFTTNRHGFDNFELYVVDRAGTREPVRVTFTDGFDGLPAFSPEGRKLAWTSNRTPNGQSQLFLANWNHAAAMRLLGKSPKRDRSQRIPDREIPKVTKDEIAVADLQRHVETLAADRMEGRATGTVGEKRATQYVADQFAAIGLEPAGDDGGYFQSFTFTAGVKLGPQNELTVLRDGADDITAEVDEHWRPLSFSELGTFAPTQVAFAGYGIVAPATPEFERYDSYGDLDVEDKWVLVLRYLPEDVDAKRRQHLNRYASLRYKAMIARDRGAAGLVVVSGPTSGVKQDLIELKFDASIAGTSIPAVTVTDALGATILEESGRSLNALQKRLDTGQPVDGFVIPGTRITARIDLELEQRTGRNVIARLKAPVAAAANPALLIGAHVDHLGRGEGGNSLARGREAGEIHHGADDNASGVAAMLEIAEYLKARHEAGRLHLHRDVVFAAWSGEELGLLGSEHFAEELDQDTFEENDISEKLAACINLDMVGRYDADVTVQGVGSSSIWRRELERRNVPVGLSLSLSNESYLPTDATSFYLMHVPILSFFTGAHEDYHTPRDTPEKLNYRRTADIAKLAALIADSLAEDEDAPDYIRLEQKRPTGSRANLRAYLGTIPDYGETPIPGLKLSGVATGGPAHTAGVRGADIVVELGGRKIENIYDYTYALDALKPGEVTTIVVVRDGERIEYKMTVGSRE